MDLKVLFVPISSRTGWIRFFGIMLIVYGALTALTIVGIVVAWIPIWLGVLLIRTADASKSLMISHDSDYATELLENLGKFFQISGIVTLVFLILYVIAFLIWIPLIIALIASFPSEILIR